MEEMRRGDQLICYDRERTLQAYASLQRGGCEECGCSSCRNFSAQRSTAYPIEFRSILDALGIDAGKEGEVYECGPEDGRRVYGGWFYFAGKLLEAGERLTETAEGFQYYFVDAKQLWKPSAEFGDDIAAVEFYARIPWVLSEKPG